MPNSNPNLNLSKTMPNPNLRGVRRYHSCRRYVVVIVVDQSDRNCSAPRCTTSAPFLDLTVSLLTVTRTYIYIYIRGATVHGIKPNRTVRPARYPVQYALNEPRSFCVRKLINFLQLDSHCASCTRQSPLNPAPQVNTH